MNCTEHYTADLLFYFDGRPLELSLYETLFAALDAALTAAGFDPANAEHFTVQVNSSIGVLPNDRYPEDGVTCKLTLPQATKGQMAQEYYLVQMCTADGRFRKAGDIIVTPVRMDTYDKNGLKFTAYSQSIVALAWKPLY